jgi:leucyl aminopeptidase
MNVTVVSARAFDHRTPLTAVLIAKKDPRHPWLAELRRLFGPLIDRLLRSREFGAEEEAVHLLHGQPRRPGPRFLLVGLGEARKVEYETLRRAAARAVRTCSTMGLDRLTIALPLHLPSLDRPIIARSIAEGALLADYRFDRYQTSHEKKSSAVRRLTLLAPLKPDRELPEAVRRAVITCEAANFTRDLANTPGNDMPPRELARRVDRMSKEYGLRCRVLDERRLRSLKMHGILTVARGSAQPPRFVIMEHRPRRTVNNKPIVLVGKGLTFDAGGISIKPAADMDRMKFDMSGAAAVVGVLMAVARLKLPLYVVGLVPASENLPGSAAYKPGDVIRMYSGKTVEVINTDAEGRIILADALAYAHRYRPEAIIDLATLTGHCVVALGSHAAGLIGTSDKVKQRLLEAARITGERVWELPLYSEHEKMIKSHIADIKNSAGRPAGASTAAAFLKQFVADVPWIHLDIAGTAYTEEESAYTSRASSTAFGVRLVVEMLERWT